jgi:hypothetical protein
MRPPSPIVLALVLLVQCAAAAPPSDLLYGPAYSPSGPAFGGTDPLAHAQEPRPRQLTTTESAVVPALPGPPGPDDLLDAGVDAGPDADVDAALAPTLMKTEKPAPPSPR